MKLSTKSEKEKNHDGYVIVEDEYTTLKFKRVIQHPREAVWKSITDPIEIANWFNTKAVIEIRQIYRAQRIEETGIFKPGWRCREIPFFTRAVYTT